MNWIVIARVLFTVLSLFAGTFGVANSIQAGNNALEATGDGGVVGFSVFDIMASVIPLIASVASGLAAIFAPSFFPKGLNTKEFTEAVQAIIAWYQDRENPKKLRAAGLECVDVLTDIVGQGDPEIQATLATLSQQLHKKYGMIPVQLMNTQGRMGTYPPMSLATQQLLHQQQMMQNQMMANQAAAAATRI